MGEFRMPSLGAGMEDGVLVEWHVKPGDEVRRGDIVAVVDTFKGAIEIEVFEAGVIDELRVEEGSKIPVGAVMATIRAAGEPAAAEAAPAEAAAEAEPAAEAAAEPRREVPPEAEPEVEAEAAAEPVPAPPEAAAEAPRRPAPGERVRASPAARLRAGELGVDLASLHGTGPDGAVTLSDVEEAAAVAAPEAAPAAAPEAPPRPARVTPVARRVARETGIDLAGIEGTGPGGAVTREDVERAASVTPSAAPPADRREAMRQAIAAAMARSKREIPHYYLGTTVDMSRALEWLEAANRERPMEERLLPAALLLKAVAHAVTAVPELNGFWIDGGFRPAEAVHVGVVTHLRGGGLVAPALHDVDTKTVDAVMAGLRDLVQRARAGGLRSSEVADPTITVTNLGDRGVESVYGVIYPPQVAIVGFGRIVTRPWAEEGMLGVRPVVVVTLAADHRASDGHGGARFLNQLERRLQRPDTL